MAFSEQLAESAAERYAVLRPHLDERQRRMLLGVEAAGLGRGGIKAIAEATGVHPDTIARGVREVEGTRSRRRGCVHRVEAENPWPRPTRTWYPS